MYADNYIDTLQDSITAIEEEIQRLRALVEAIKEFLTIATQ
jgi:cell division septum initiation protein DivIVA